MKKLVIFGFDGTIADTSPGILHCFNTTAVSMGHMPIERKRLVGIIGFPLKDGLRKLYGMTDEEIEYASNNYSKLYSIKGKEMFYLYDGIEESLAQLKNDGYLLAVATQKHEMYTKDILQVHDTAKYFDIICATDVDSGKDKCSLLRMACDRLNVAVEDSVSIGDNYRDAQAASQIGMDFMATLYGWGFRSRQDAESYNCKAYLESANDIYNKVKAL